MRWSLIDILIHFLGAEPHSIARLLYLNMKVSHWDELCDGMFNGAELAGFKGFSFPFCRTLFTLSLPSFCELALWGWGRWTDRMHQLSPNLAMPTFQLIRKLYTRSWPNFIKNRPNVAIIVGQTLDLTFLN